MKSPVVQQPSTPADNSEQSYYYLAIVLDKEVISCPHIASAIAEGQGLIQGAFTLDEAKALAIQLRYGLLPVKLKVESVRTVPPEWAVTGLGQAEACRSKLPTEHLNLLSRQGEPGQDESRTEASVQPVQARVTLAPVP